MKLTNKQLSLVVDMIYDKAKPSIDSQREQEEKQLKAEATKKIKASTLFKQIEKAFQSCPIMSEIKFKEVPITKHYPWIN
jgi:hypothetical protein